jgi:CRP-like cAMP-binding protein
MQQVVYHQIELLQAQAHLAIACQSLHTVEQRLCRRLLECDEHSGGVTPLPFTQQRLAVMLAVQRTTVTKFASALQDDGLIRYSRGTMRIANREGLERRSCACRATLVNLRASLAAWSRLLLPSL